MTIEEILSAMKAIADSAETENRALSDEEITKYEALEADLAKARKTVEIRSRQAAYETPTVHTNPITGNAKGDEVLERAFDHYLRTGQQNSDLVELRAQSTSTTAGGYTVPAGFRQKLVDVRKAFGGIRSEAEVITTDSGSTLTYPSNNDTANVGSIISENASLAAGADLVFGQVSLGAFKYSSNGTGTAALKVSRELLQDSAFDVNGLVSRKLGERIHRAQAAHFATGVGTTEPKGLATTTSDENDGGTTLTYAKLNAAFHDLDPSYRDNAVWVMNDSTLEELEALVDNAGRPLLQESASAGIGGAISPTIKGKRIVVDNGMVTTSGYNYVIFGDVGEGYIIRDVDDVEVIVDPFSYSANGQVGYTAFARADGTIQNRSAYVTVKSHRVA